MEILNYIKKCQKRVESALRKRLPPTNKTPQELHRAMHYALAGGKRLRSTVAYAVGDELHANASVLNDVCAAIEMIHAASLIHDDLPALDNDQLRRGKPTCHKVFGEATAILAGDALIGLAFEILAKLDKKMVSAEAGFGMIQSLAHAIGSEGLSGGEDLDLKIIGKRVTSKKLKTIYHFKTCSLLSASLILGALAANCQNKTILRNLIKFAECIGLAFQIHDDIIGIEATTKTLGKTGGLDIVRKKPIYPVLVGMKKAKQREQMLFQKALIHLDKTGINTKKLKALAAYFIKRNY